MQEKILKAIRSGKPGRYIIPVGVKVEIPGLQRISWTYRGKPSLFHLCQGSESGCLPDTLCHARIPVNEYESLMLGEDWKPRGLGKRWCGKCIKAFTGGC